MQDTSKKQAPDQGLSLKYDGDLQISVANSRMSTAWRPRIVKWSDFILRQQRVTRTGETAAEYSKMSKARQSEVKDVGGYVGGLLKGGRRKAQNVAQRSLLTLDLDFAPKGFWDELTMLHDYAAMVYSTHSHTPDKPRLRLVIPLAQPVKPDEYEAIARKVAASFNIDYFDDTTYQPERLMFNASCPADVEYICEYQDGPWLSPDAVLAEYSDWRDITEWPESSRSQGIKERSAKKQGDPLTKPGIIGAFCRAYPIEEAIDTFLSDVYEPSKTKPHRYTYRGGTSADGLVIYDDVFAYSYHSTDPTSGELCNAFDLVRLHLYGLEDEGVKPGTPATRMPSYMRMADFIKDDKAVIAELSAEREAQIKEDFGEVKAEDTSWQSKLAYNSNGGLKQSIDNVVITLKNDPLLAGKARLNDFAMRCEIAGDLPWPSEGDYWDDEDQACLYHYLEKYRGLTSRANIDIGFKVSLQDHRYNPVKFYLEGLRWDGKPRLDTVITDYIGTYEDNAYTRAITRKTLVAAVKRVFEPGAKFDYVLVLQGGQGIGKTATVRQLAGKYVQESFTSFDGKEAVEQLIGFWIIELSELTALRRSQMESAKSFITRTVDSYRKPYDRSTSILPRQCIFIATTNDDSFINDPTGGRRWWVLGCKKDPRIEGGWEALTPDVRDQIWAEAVYRYKQGEKVYLDDPEVIEMATQKQRGATQTSDKMGLVEQYLNTLLPVGWDDMGLDERRRFLNGELLDDTGVPLVGTIPRTQVSNIEIWAECFEESPTRIPFRDSLEIKGIMSMIPGWPRDDKKKKIRLYGAQYVYKRIKNE